MTEKLQLKFHFLKGKLCAVIFGNTIVLEALMPSNPEHIHTSATFTPDTLYLFFHLAPLSDPISLSHFFGSRDVHFLLLQMMAKVFIAVKIFVELVT